MIAGRIRRGELVEERGFLWDGTRWVATHGPVRPQEIRLPLESLDLADETSFIVWDSKLQTLFIARDRWGTRPVYWRREPYGMAFATSLRWFQGLVPQVPPSHALSWDPERIQEIRYPTPQCSMDLRDALPAAVPEGPVALSGGVDSAALLLFSKGPAYTLAPPWPEYSEVEDARETARLLGREHRVIPVTERDYVEAFEDAVLAAEAPIYNLHAVSKLLLARAVAADGHRVLVCGEGADERLGDGKIGDDFAVGVAQMAAGMCAAAGLMARFPFLDHRVNAVHREGKRSLRELLPPSIAGRPKRPRLAPDLEFVAKYLPRGAAPDMREASRVILERRLCAASRES